MTELRFEKKIFKGAHLNGCSDLPAMRNSMHTKMQTRLDEDDELFVGYGNLKNILPYQMQDRYDRAEDDIEFHTAVLENDYLKATFVPDLGGRLWSLYDKVNGKDLVTNNPVFRPGNLALRDAWVCGGVEWNIGMIGHSPFTCSPIFACKVTADDGMPVLRMYEFERVRQVTYQMDFFLPEDSHFLFARMRIVNPSTDAVPMYWWSTIAVPEIDGYRVIVPAKDTFTNDYISQTERGLTKVPVPMGTKDFDLTYPTNNPIAIDYFFNIPKGQRKFETQLDPNGYGLIHTSTDRQQGRKLFVWGQGPGGHRWQRFLTSEDGLPYQEMQAGLAQTQTECLPMPPKTAWEWMEAYGAMQIDGDKVNGEWDTAVETVDSRLQQLLPREKMDEMLASTKKDFVFKKGEVIWSGSGWGALENERRLAAGLSPLSEHLDFGELQEPQKQWMHLLQTGYMSEKCPKEAPGSYMVQDEWFELLKAAVKGADVGNWYTWLHLGICYYWREDYERAQACFERSLSQQESAWGLYGLANTLRVAGELQKAATLLAKASAMRPGDISLAKEALVTLADCKDYRGILSLVQRLDEEIRIGKVEYFYACALAHLGDLDTAQAILLKDGGIEIPDIREGETSTSELWIYIQVERARREGKTLDPEDVEIPHELDFRMNVSNKK